ncbi:uncharacterized protein MONBRDRAFT_26448 [Monosiga brevicollis MX1]|uniref:Uncharacterized protein n=1 Tax=Monosiga brevicollis TaxID=81824 RepID=A9V2E2_MONBE|nr:uncharacterized protein MONBRDRAFT_26448 [Monosiga brevicollis MX1]EDQ88361.1 predicted protein [Monosiga brevicollis MX1]|eukprot:XP_001746954.1 hypothetical protein [Monosiga brevicollis MX1]
MLSAPSEADEEAVARLAQEDVASTSLDLAELEWAVIPEELYAFQNLEELYLSDNALTALPPELFEQLPFLRYVDARYNQLGFLPDTIGYHPALTTLLVGNNQLTSLPVEMGYSESLRQLNLRNNPLYFPPTEVVAQGCAVVLQYLRERAGPKDPNRLVQQMTVLTLDEEPELPLPTKPALEAEDTQAAVSIVQSTLCESQPISPEPEATLQPEELPQEPPEAPVVSNMRMPKEATPPPPIQEEPEEELQDDVVITAEVSNAEILSEHAEEEEEEAESTAGEEESSEEEAPLPPRTILRSRPASNIVIPVRTGSPELHGGDFDLLDQMLDEKRSAANSARARSALTALRLDERASRATSARSRLSGRNSTSSTFTRPASDVQNPVQDPKTE